MSDYVPHTETYRGWTISIVHDQTPMSPRDSMSNAGILMLEHRGYAFPNEGLFNKPGDDEGWADVAKEIAKTHHGALIWPVYFRDGNEVDLSIGSDFERADGLVWMTKETALEEWAGVKVLSPRIKKLAEQCVIGELEIYAKYVSGDCWGYTADPPEGSTAESDSCWGYIGDEEWDYMLKCAREHVDAVIDAVTGDSLLAANLAATG